MHTHKRSNLDVYFHVNGDFSGDAIVNHRKKPNLEIRIPAWRLLTGEVSGYEGDVLTTQEWCQLVALANEDWRSSKIISFVENLSAREFAEKQRKEDAEWEPPARRKRD